MSKKVINQKSNLSSELLNSIESDFNFAESPINRLKNTNNYYKDNTPGIDKKGELDFSAIVNFNK